MKFTVLIPTFDHGVVIRSAIDSILEQSVADFEIFVVCDGSPPETHDVVAEYGARDRRIRAFKFEKGARHGEASRHKALAEAAGEAVCYLCDDDFWFPDHLAVMKELLADADFVNARQAQTSPDYLIMGETGDLNNADTRARMTTTRYNFFGPTVAAHRLDAYRRLPQGWSPAPEGLWTDLHMWRKWIAADGMRLRSSMKITSLHMPRSARVGQTREAAFHENAFWRELFRDPFMREGLRDAIPRDRTKIGLARIAARAAVLRNEARKRAETTLAAAEARLRALQSDRDAALLEVEAQRTARQELLDSTIWRATKPLRDTINALRPPRARRD
jgi:glycosyltransferase involved in cell wall biosynthesis